jgi:hypothetical protein
MTDTTKTETRCSLCGGVWHPATGMLVGSPSEFPACGRCSRELLAQMGDALQREIRVSSRARAAWRAAPKAERGPRPWVSFYEAANTSIGAIRRND